jgi:hypothetical protein
MNRTPARVRERRRRHEGTVGVSLFPFLVVLICTMGGLILLLVVIARQARLQAAQETTAASAKLRENLQAAREWVQLAISGYRESRQKTEAQLAEARLALGHVEDHARRLAEELARLEAAWSRLNSLQADGARRRDEWQAELDRLRHEIVATRQALSQAQEAADRRRGSYAVVPYEGPHATRRRPIYIECRSDAVVLQPGEIALHEDDFRGPLGPGNPLDVALRAIREYLLRSRQLAEDESGEPYPLLLVRPSGIAAYYAARAAMQSWAFDFGYELIGEDWKLDFPSPDPSLTEEVRVAIETARVRQRLLMAAAPRRYGSRPSPRYVAAPYRGGLIPEGGLPDDHDSGYQPRQPSGRVGSRFATGQRDEHEHVGGWGTALGAGLPTSPSSVRGQEILAPREPLAPSPNSPAANPRGETVAGARQPQAGQPGAMGGSPALAGSDGQLGPYHDPPRAAGDGDQPERASSPSDQQHAAVAIAVGRPRSLAKVRGRNWGLPNAVGGSVAITSPIRIDCFPDRLVLVPERNLGQPTVVPLGPRTEDGLDTLVSAVWQYMERWGSAGTGMYWRPVLNVRVAPAAEARYADLKILLEGSGLEVTRKDEG